MENGIFTDFPTGILRVFHVNGKVFKYPPWFGGWVGGKGLSLSFREADSKRKVGSPEVNYR